MTTSVAERVRRHRHRRQAAQLVLPYFVVDPAMIDLLVEARLLAEWDENNPEKIREALTEFLTVKATYS